MLPNNGSYGAGHFHPTFPFPANLSVLTDGPESDCRKKNIVIFDRPAEE
jgi:hypothetical protein